MGILDRSRSISLVLAAGAILAFVLQHPSGGWTGAAIAPAPGHGALRASADGPVPAVATPQGCDKPVLELFPPGQRFTGAELSARVTGSCPNVGYSANDVMSVSRDGKTWFIKMERLDPASRDEYRVKWVKTEADYLESFGH